MTHTANRRRFLRGFESLAGPATLVVFDIDHFKAINDRFGHYADEFAALLPNVSSNEAKALAERIRRGVERLR